MHLYKGSVKCQIWIGEGQLVSALVVVILEFYRHSNSDRRDSYRSISGVRVVLCLLLQRGDGEGATGGH